MSIYFASDLHVESRIDTAAGRAFRRARAGVKGKAAVRARGAYLSICRAR